MKKIKLGPIICILPFLVIFSGCATGSSNSAGIEKNLSVASSLRFDDVPVPAGFNQVPDESFIFQTESLRAGVLKYTGKSSPESVMQFYKDEMPRYNWQSVNIVEFGKKQLCFEKTGQNCIVIIDGTKSKSTIIISVGPKSEKQKPVK